MIYAELFEAKGWTRVDRQARVMGGGTKTECLWLSPRTAKALASSDLINQRERLPSGAKTKKRR